MSKAVYRRDPRQFYGRLKRWIGTKVVVVGAAEPVKGPTRKLVTSGTAVEATPLAGPVRQTVLVGASTEADPLLGVPRAVRIGGGSNSLEEV